MLKHAARRSTPEQQSSASSAPALLRTELRALSLHIDLAPSLVTTLDIYPATAPPFPSSQGFSYSGWCEGQDRVPSDGSTTDIQATALTHCSAQLCYCPSLDCESNCKLSDTWFTNYHQKTTDPFTFTAARNTVSCL